MILRLLSLNFPKLPLRQKANYFNLNHATVLHSIRASENLFETSAKYRNWYVSVTEKIRGLLGMQIKYLEIREPNQYRNQHNTNGDNSNNRH